MRSAIATEDAPRPVGPYSQAVRCGDMVFVSGQLGIDPSTGKLVEGGPRAEAARCMDNVKAILSSAGLELRDVVKTTIFVTDISSFKEVNQAYASYFPSDPPARSTVGVASLPLGAKVEIEVIACRVTPSP